MIPYTYMHANIKALTAIWSLLADCSTWKTIPIFKESIHSSSSSLQNEGGGANGNEETEWGENERVFPHRNPFQGGWHSYLSYWEVWGEGGKSSSPPLPPPKKQTNKTTNANDVFIVKVLHFFVCSGTALHLSALARDFEHYLIHIVSSLSGLLRVE